MEFWPYWLGYVLFSITFPIFFRWKVKGCQNVPLKGPLIVAPNHISYLDPPLRGAAIGYATKPNTRPVWFIAKSELFENHYFGSLISACRSYPVHQGQVDRYA